MAVNPATASPKGFAFNAVLKPRVATVARLRPRFIKFGCYCGCVYCNCICGNGSS